MLLMFGLWRKIPCFWFIYRFEWGVWCYLLRQLIWRLQWWETWCIILILILIIMFFILLIEILSIWFLILDISHFLDHDNLSIIAIECVRYINNVWMKNDILFWQDGILNTCIIPFIIFFQEIILIYAHIFDQIHNEYLNTPLHREQH